MWRLWECYVCKQITLSMRFPGDAGCCRASCPGCASQSLFSVCCWTTMWPSRQQTHPPPSGECFFIGEANRGGTCQGVLLDTWFSSGPDVSLPSWRLISCTDDCNPARKPLTSPWETVLAAILQGQRLVQWGRCRCGDPALTGQAAASSPRVPTIWFLQHLPVTSTHLGTADRTYLCFAPLCAWLWTRVFVHTSQHIYSEVLGLTALEEGTAAEFPCRLGDV